MGTTTTIYCKECGEPRVIDVRNKKSVTRCVFHQYQNRLVRNQWRIKENKKARALMGGTTKECAICGQKRKIAIDHVLPLSMGGKTEIKNLRWLCEKHNHEEYWRQKTGKGRRK